MSKKTVISAFAALCFAAVLATSASSATVAEEIKTARDVIASNSVDRTVRCRYYQAWFIDQCAKKERDSILRRNISAHKRLIELEPGNAAHHVSLGRVYAAVGLWKDAKAELEIALAPGAKLDVVSRTSASWEMANCLWIDGDKTGARKLLADIATMKPGNSIPPYHKFARYLDRAYSDPDGDLDAFKFPWSKDGKPFPTPQDAKYGEKKVLLERIELKTVGLKSDDPIARLLKKKLARFGSKFEKGGTKVNIEISPDTPVDKPQGYLLEVKSKKEEGRSGEYGVVSIKARDRLGATWGVVSLIQCIDRDALNIRECYISDWPACLRRGVLANWDPDHLEYSLFNKMSSVDFGMDIRRHEQYVLEPLEKERFRIFASRFRDFGIELFVDTAFISVRPCMPFTTPRAFKIHVAWARFFASLGIGPTMMFDDTRFPVPKIDLDTVGSAANLDAKFITRLYREVKKDYPDFRMMFCPPFYWGPDGGVSYPEPREAYLKSIGEFLDPEIDVYWTGPRVKSSNMQNDKVEWFSNLIGRKPSVFHNGDCVGRHNYIQYGADVPAFKESHSKELFDRIAAFHMNTSRYQGATTVGSCMDWCWNPYAHDAVAAARRTVEMMEGPGVFEIIRDATPSLAYFDKYIYGRPRSEVLAESQSDIDRRVADADAAWKRVEGLAKNEGLFVADFARCGLAWARGIAECRRNPPSELVEQRKAEMANTVFAKDEVGFDEAKGDIFFPAEMLIGGYYVVGVGRHAKHGLRAVKYVDVGCELSGTFSCERFPPERPYRFIVVGVEWNRYETPAELEVNGRVVWRGRPFVRDAFHPFEVELPVDAMARSNSFVFRNTAPADEKSRKVEVHYVVIRK